MANDLKTSLGIWAMGGMVTRFVPVGYQPEHGKETTAEKVHRAVEGLGDLIDDYEFHYPQELSADNLDEVRAALDGHGIYCVATGLHLDPIFGRGGLVSPDRAVRAEAREAHRRGRRLRRARSARTSSSGPGSRATTTPSRRRTRESWAWLIEGIGQAAAAIEKHGRKLFLEHKNSEPAMKILMRNIGMTLHVIHKLRAEGVTNVQVNMDWQHLLMNGENLAEYAAMLAAEGLLGHQHANSGWGTFDDDNMVGATAFMETVELALELRRAKYGSQRRAPRPRPLPLHRGPGRGGAAVGRAVALHRLGRGAHRRRGAARGAAAQGRGRRVRARLRRAGGARAGLMTRLVGLDVGHHVGQGHRDRRSTARSSTSPSAATRCRPRGRAGASRTPS